jgi:hypothetical protein
MATDTFRLAASSGWKLVDDTSAHTDQHYGVQAREDTVIATWTAKGGTLDLVARFGLSGKTITTADPAILIPDTFVNQGTQSITLTSGSINLLLK